MKRHPSRLLVAALAMSLLAACSTAKDTGGKAANDKADNGKSSSAPAGNGPGAPGDPAANGASGIGIDQPDPSKAIFSKELAVPPSRDTFRRLSVALVTRATSRLPHPCSLQAAPEPDSEARNRPQLSKPV